MKRFYSNENEPNDDDDDFNIYDEEAELNDGEMATAYAFISEGDLAEAMQLDLAEQELDQELMDKAIGLAKQSWFWWFKSNQKKTAEIEFIYRELRRILDHQQQPNQEEPEKEEE